MALASFAASVVATHWAEDWARHLTDDRGWRVVLMAVAYLAVSGVFFLAKFVLYELLVFTPGASRRGPRGPPAAGTTRS